MSIDLTFDCQLIGIGTHDNPFDSDDIADIRFDENVVIVFSHDFFGKVTLNGTVFILNVNKADFSLSSFGHQSTGNPNGKMLLFQLFFRIRFVRSQNGC